MPKRQAVTKFTSEKVQGEDSYVILRPLTVGDWNEIRRQRRQAEGKSKRDNYETLRRVIVDWNWVDDADQPLPKPKDDPAVFDRLLPAELEYLADCVEEMSGTDSGN